MPQRADTDDEIQPLIELCKAGQLFEVQAWIAAGKPVNPPPLVNRGNRRRTPLEVAIERGFHSLVLVLLQAGAVIEPLQYNGPMQRALEQRRFDLVQLLVDHGFDVKSISMDEVFACWDPEVMEYFIDRGAEVERGKPLANALCNRIRTALRVLKKYRDRFPSFQEQANIALRHHCKEGNLKWVSLMLWAGAEPYAPGSNNCTEEEEGEDEGLSALGFAALHNHFDIFQLRQVRLDPANPATQDVVRYACGQDQGTELVKQLLEKGLNPNDQDNGGCSTIQYLLTALDWEARLRVAFSSHLRYDSDTSAARDKIKGIHLLAKYGAQWIPEDKSQLNAARRALLNLAPDYTTEFVWIMTKYQSCACETLQALLRTPAMKKHTAAHRHRIQELLASWE